MSEQPNPPPAHGSGYAPLTQFAAPAVASSELWRSLAVLVLLLVLSNFTQTAILALIKALYGPLQGAMMMVDIAMGLTPRGVVSNLAMAVPMGLVFLLALGLLTGRGLTSLLGRRERLLPDMARAGLPVLALGLVPLVLADGSVAQGQAGMTLLLWLPLALPALILACASTEILFRGFLQQQLAARFAPSWIWMGLPAVLFALMQGTSHDLGPLAVLGFLWNIAFAMATADLTARTGSLGAAIGLQSGIQAQSLFFLGLKGPMNGLALHVLDLRGMALLPWMAADFLVLLIGWLAARLWMRV
jgi:membrane protease YdiL (CAAX protease family)